mmetsp:Transcript_30721/g.62463  ORF Transcript_30721/g.62463 Transcript_30721/m.62463 type:complete len:549 (-) Transcript_30721:60-1706(-)
MPDGDLNTCPMCGKTRDDVNSEELKVCRGCNRVAYCGKDCQRAHWKAGHKHKCKESKPATSVPAPVSTPPPPSVDTAQVLQKKKKPPLDDRECANCSVPQHDAKLSACTRCRLVFYCGQACQLQHWNIGEHKKFCVATEARTPGHSSCGAATMGSLNEIKCAICLDEVDDTEDGKSVVLPCSHIFHVECVTDLRSYGVVQVCPLCSAALPKNPQALYEDATRLNVQLERRLCTPHPYGNPYGTQCNCSWGPLSARDKKDAKEVIRLTLLATKEGYGPAENMLGCYYDCGRIVPQDHMEAQRWYKRSAKHSEVEGQYNLALSHINGLGVPKNTVEGNRWLQQLAKKKHKGAQRALGNQYLSGDGVVQNNEKALHYFLLAANQGEVHAYHNLSTMYYEGTGCQVNYSESVKWARKGAAKGATEAMGHLGLLCFHGRGVSKDRREAARWYGLAAKGGNMISAGNLGIMYKKGDGVERNYEKALELFTAAAGAGHCQAFYQLGAMHHCGWGVPQNTKKAVAFFEKAAAAGFQPAALSQVLIDYHATGQLRLI